jgi:hypothetical protein
MHAAFKAYRKWQEFHIVVALQLDRLDMDCALHVVHYIEMPACPQ